LFVLKICQIICKYGVDIFSPFFRLLPINNKKIVFQSFNAGSYACNPKYITEALLGKNKYDIVWIFNDCDSVSACAPNGVRKVKNKTLKSAYEMATAGIWVDNMRKSRRIKKRSKQFYIQTWHGTPLKKIEKDVETKLAPGYVKNAKKDSAMCNLMISGNQYTTKVMKTIFWYNGEVLECGTPRNDILFRTRNHEWKDIRNVLAIPDNHYVATYAPTFRKNSKLTLMDFSSLIEALERSRGGKWCFLLRVHPNVVEKIDISSLVENSNNLIIDASRYRDMAEILFVTDFLFTDYSSSMFDFCLTRRPCILFTHDEDNYGTEERGFYMKLDDLPFPRARVINDLITEIIFFDDQSYQTRVNDFLEYIGNAERGNASETIVKCIEDLFT
jgi:CDP-glycerol glycerophosphotransferase